MSEQKNAIKANAISTKSNQSVGSPTVAPTGSASSGTHCDEYESVMMRYKEEQDRYIASLVSGQYDGKEHAHDLAEGVNRLVHDIHGPEKAFDKAAHASAVKKTIQEMDHLKASWDKMSAETAPFGRDE